MTATRDDWCIEQGATFKRSIKWFESDETTPVDLNGFTARVHIRETVESPDILVSLVSPADITLGGVAGTIQILISATNTAALAFTEGVYDLELEDSSGEVTRLTFGGVSVSPEVTR